MSRSPDSNSVPGVRTSTRSLSARRSKGTESRTRIIAVTGLARGANDATGCTVLGRLSADAGPAVSRERPSRGRFRRRRRAAANRSALSFPTVVGHGPMAERGHLCGARDGARSDERIQAVRNEPLLGAFFRRGEFPSRIHLVSLSLSLSLVPSGLVTRFESKRADPAHGRRSRRDLSRGAERAGPLTSREGGQT